MITALVACGPSAEDGRKAARQEYDTQMKIKAEQSAGQTIRPPVPNRKQIPCDQLIDVGNAVVVAVDPLAGHAVEHAEEHVFVVGDQAAGAGRAAEGGGDGATAGDAIGVAHVAGGARGHLQVRPDGIGELGGSPGDPGQRNHGEQGRTLQENTGYAHGGPHRYTWSWESRVNTPTRLPPYTTLCSMTSRRISA